MNKNKKIIKEYNNYYKKVPYRVRVTGNHGSKKMKIIKQIM